MNAAIIGQNRDFRQPENADIPIFAWMLGADGAVANPLQRAEPALRQIFCTCAVEHERGRQNAVFAVGFV